MTNQEIAKILRQVAAAYILKDANKFKIIAYERAADSVEKMTVDIKDLWQNGALSTIPGLGKAIISHIDELFRTGRVKHFNQVLKGLPSCLFPLLDVAGLGSKKAYKLVKVLKLKDPNTVIDDLLELAKRGKIASIQGFGEKSQRDIMEALERFKKGQNKTQRIPLPIAYNIASEVISYLKKNPFVIEAVTLGSLRRMTATVGDIDIAVSTNNPQEVVNWFLKYPKKAKVVEKGVSGATIILNNERQIDLRVQSPSGFGAMLQYFTGSKNHNIHLREYALKKGLSLSEYGIRPLNNFQFSKFKSERYNRTKKVYEFKNEKDFYNALDLNWIAPEIREDNGEIEAAANNELPQLVEEDDLKGELHIHSNYNLEPSHDLGRSSVEDILSKASELGYEYVGISDHNPSYTNHTPTQILKLLKVRKEKFEQIMLSNKNIRVKLFIMLEIDILPDGEIPIPPEATKYLDAFIVSVHSSFNMRKEKMTERILKGLRHPKAKILGHPTGRLIGFREGYEVDWPKIFRYCLSYSKAIEINAYPDRLDLPDILVREAIRNGVRLIIDTDSHEASQMEFIKFGISVARRGWAKKSDIINTMNYNRVKEWLIKS